MGDVEVIVLNDDHNTFESFFSALAKTIPGVDLAKATLLAETIESTGQVVVWSGSRKLAKIYHAQLEGYGLTMASPTRWHSTSVALGELRRRKVPLWLYYTLYYLGASMLLVFPLTTAFPYTESGRWAWFGIAVALSLFFGVRRARQWYRAAAVRASTAAASRASTSEVASSETVAELATPPRSPLPIYLAGALGAALVGRLSSRGRAGKRRPTL